MHPRLGGPDLPDRIDKKLSSELGLFCESSNLHADGYCVKQEYQKNKQNWKKKQKY